MLACIHANTMYDSDPRVRCGKPAFTLRSHGWLCIPHYRQQQEDIPAKPRKHQPVWRGFRPAVQSDEAIIADILRTETQAIANGRVEAIACGVIDPIYLKVLHD